MVARILLWITVALLTAPAAAQQTQTSEAIDPWTPSVQTIAAYRRALKAAPPETFLQGSFEGVATTTSGTIGSRGSSFFLQDETGGLLVRNSEAIEIAEGERFAVSGRVYRDADGEIELRVASLNRLGRGAGAEPRPVTIAEVFSGAYEGELLRVRGTLQELSAAGNLLVLHVGDVGLRAYWVPGLASLRAEDFPQFEAGSMVEITGISRPRREGGVVDRHQIRLRGPQDLMLVEPPPAFDPGVLWLSLLLAAIACAAAVVWIAQLRRSVSAKTAEIQSLLDSLEQRVAERTAELADANQQLEVAKDKAEEADRLKSEFLANISHEIRSPMTVVRGMTELVLRADRLDPDDRRHLEMVGSSTDTLQRILNDLLDFSRIEAGHAKLESTRFDLALLTAETVDFYRPRAREKGLTLGCETDPKLPLILTQIRR